MESEVNKGVSTMLNCHRVSGSLRRQWIAVARDIDELSRFAMDIAFVGIVDSYARQFNRRVPVVDPIMFCGGLRFRCSPDDRVRLERSVAFAQTLMREETSFSQRLDASLGIIGEWVTSQSGSAKPRVWWNRRDRAWEEALTKFKTFKKHGNLSHL